MAGHFDTLNSRQFWTLLSPRDLVQRRHTTEGSAPFSIGLGTHSGNSKPAMENIFAHYDLGNEFYGGG